MAVRSKRLAQALLPSNGTFVTIYTCPANETAIVKYQTLYNETVLAGIFFTLRMVTAAGTIIVDEREFTGAGIYKSEPYLILGPTDRLEARSSPTTVMRVALFGVELEGVAD